MRLWSSAASFLSVGNLRGGHLSRQPVTNFRKRHSGGTHSKFMGSGQVQPGVGLDVILRNTLAFGVAEAQGVLTPGVSLLGGQPEPLDGRAVVLRHSSPRA